MDLEKLYNKYLEIQKEYIEIIKNKGFNIFEFYFENEENPIYEITAPIPKEHIKILFSYDEEVGDMEFNMICPLNDQEIQELYNNMVYVISYGVKDIIPSNDICNFELIPHIEFLGNIFHIEFRDPIKSMNIINKYSNVENFDKWIKLFKDHFKDPNYTKCKYKIDFNNIYLEKIYLSEALELIDPNIDQWEYYDLIHE